MTLAVRITFLLIAVSCSVAVAQTIESVTPSVGQQGQTLPSVVIVGKNTSFVQGPTTVSFSGTGINVNSTTVNSSTQITVSITITSGATPGNLNVTVTTGQEVAQLIAGFTVNQVANKLAFTTEPPANGTAGQALNPVVVQVQDGGGRVVSGSSASISITSSPAGLVGAPVVVSAANGVAMFNSLVFNTVGSYTLSAASSGLAGDISTPVAIAAGTASKLVITQGPPSTGTAGVALSPSVIVQVQDANGNVVTNSSASVTVSSTPAGVGGTTNVSASSGVATFSNLVFNTSGSYTVTAASAGLTPSPASSPVSIGAGTPTKLVFTQQPPASVPVNQALSPAVVVQIQDSNGNVVSSNASVTITSTPSGVGGTTTVNAAAGIATFSNLTFSTNGGYTLTAAASSLSLTSLASNSINVTDTASQIVFTTPPSNGNAGQALSPSVVVKIEDASSNVVNTSASVTITSTPAGVGGSTSVNAVNGVATFGNLTFAATGNYTLTAAAASLSLSSTPTAQFTISAGTPTKLSISTEPPANGTAGQPMTVVVQVQDAGSNPVTTSSAQISINSTPAGLVGGPVVVNATSGVATFNSLTFNAVGTYTLTATSAGLTSATTTSVTIAPGTATKLGLPVQPPNGTAGVALSPAVVIQVQDANGNVVTTGAASTTSVAISSTPAGVTGTVNAVNGVATFSALSFSTPGPYTLTALASGLAPVTSNSFTISAGSGNKLVMTVQPPANGNAGQALSPAIVVQVQDSVGNVVTGSSAPVTFSSTPAGVTGTVTVNAASGVATFSNLVFNAANTYTLTASSAGLTPATSSSSVIIAAGTASKLAITSQPASGTSGVAITPSVVVQVQDSSGNLISGSTAPVTITSSPTGVTGTLQVNAVAGVATFSNLLFPTTGSYTLTAASSGLASTLSSAISIGGLAITTATLNPATRSTAFTQQLTATGGTLPYTWSMTSGTLGSNVTLGSSGLVNGTPPASGNFTFTAHVKDNLGATADQILTLVVANALTFTSCPAATGVVGQVYSSSATASGGSLPLSWSLLSGSFPPGLSMNSNGAVTGTPTAAGTYSATLQALDRANAIVSQVCGFTIAPGLSITTVTVSDASVGAAYTQTLLASGGKGPYVWTLTSGSLPQGLSLSSGGVISGTPTQTGTSNFTVTATDSLNVGVQQAYTMKVVAGLIIGACPASLAEVGFAYNSSLVAQGGTPPYLWSLTTGTLPAGLQLVASSGVVTGTPTTVGVSQLTFTTADKGNLTATKQCSIDVRAGLTISTASLSVGNTNAPYSDSIAVTGGVSPFVFSTTAGALPPGVTLDAGTGKLGGQPTSAGAFQFTVAVSDSVGAQATKALSITVAAGLTITNCPTPVASVGQSYSGSLVAQGGTAPYSWSVASGLPPGLSVDSPNAVISGTPSTAGTFPFVLQVSDAVPKTTTRSCSIQVSAAPLAITSSASLPNALIGIAYTQTLAATGGVTPYTWAVSGGALPASFNLDPTGVLSGTPTTAGTFNFTVQATDQGGTVARQAMTLVVLAGTAPNVTITGLTDLVDPASQPTFNLQFASSYPAPISGTVTMTVVPDSAVGVKDPAVAFSNGTQTLAFTVDAGKTTPNFAVPAAFQTGTVAATITLTVKLTSGGTDITPSTAPTRSVRVDRLAPHIVSMTATQTAGGFQVQIVGYSTTREVTQGSFQVAVSSGSPLSATVPMSTAGTAWFSNQTSQQFGGLFSLTQPFTFQGSVGTLTSVTATLSNAQGTSAPMTVNF